MLRRGMLRGEIGQHKCALFLCFSIDDMQMLCNEDPPVSIKTMHDSRMCHVDIHVYISPLNPTDSVLVLNDSDILCLQHRAIRCSQGDSFVYSVTEL